MNRKRLRKLRTEIAGLRRKAGNVHHREVETIAQAFGRVLRDRGKEPTWTRDGWPPLSIPSHGSHSALAIGTAKNILRTLDDDADRIEEELPEDEDDDDD